MRSGVPQRYTQHLFFNTFTLVSVKIYHLHFLLFSYYAVIYQVIKSMEHCRCFQTDVIYFTFKTSNIHSEYYVVTF